jgi:hypothetical protein
VVDNQVYNLLDYYVDNSNRMNNVQDKRMQDVQYYHKRNRLLFLNSVVENTMFGIVVVVENEIHFVVEIVLNQIDDIYDDDVIVVVVDDVVVIDVVVDVAVDVVVDDGMMIVVVEMDDDFVRFVPVVYSFRLIVLLNDH